MSHPSFAVIDFETTGFAPTDRILEIGVALVDSAGRLEKSWHSLIQPDRHFDNSHIHGIKPADVAIAPTFERVAAEFAELIDGRIIVAHNAGFDTRFLVQAFSQCGVDLGDPRDWSLCTMRSSRGLLNGASKKLSDCLSEINAVNCQPHAAVADAEATTELLAYILSNSPTLALPQPLAISEAGWQQLHRLPSAQPVHRDEETLSAQEGEWLNALADKLPQSGDHDVDSYVRALRAAMADGHLCASEIAHLIDRAEQLGIDREEALWIHSHFVRQLAIEAWADGVVTDSEREAIRMAARQLGVDLGVVESLLAEPLVGECPDRLRLAVGARVTFTGELELPRESWESRARAAGLDVGGVCRKSYLLVAADPDTRSGKAKRARELDVPIVDEVTFARLLRELNQESSASDVSATGISGSSEHARADDALTPSPLDTAAGPSATGVADTALSSYSDGLADDEVDNDDFLWHVFPWLSSVIDGKNRDARTVDADQITIAWLDWGSSLPLYQLSPSLQSRVVPAQMAVKPKSLSQYLARLTAPLDESVTDLLSVRGVGGRFLHRFVYSLVLAALDDEADGVVGIKDNGSDNGIDSADRASQSDRLAVRTEPDESSIYDGETSIYVDDDTARTPVSADLQNVVQWMTLAGMPLLLPDEAPHTVHESFEELAQHPELADAASTAVRLASESIVQAFSEDKRFATIFARRYIGEDTLDAIGESLGVTRERVRQLQKRVAEHIDNPPSEVIVVSTALKYRYMPATPLTQIETEIPALAQPCPLTGRRSIESINVFSPEWDLHAGWLIRPGIAEAIREALISTSDEYGVTTLEAVAEAVDLNTQTLTAFSADADIDLGVSTRGKLCTQARSYSERAIALLSIVGEPMSLEDIYEEFGIGNVRSLSNSLSTEQRTVRVGPDTWALREWGLEEYESLVEWIGKRVDSGADVRLTDLIDGATALGLAESSVRTYCTNGEFIVDNGIVRRGESQDVENTSDPDEVSGFYHHGADRELLVTVTNDHVRGSGTGIARGVAAYMNVPFMDKVAMPTRLGRDQMISWNRTSAAITSIRDFVLDLGLSEGDRVWFVFGADGSFDVRRATPLQDGIDGWTAVLNRLGLDDRLPDHEPEGVSRDSADSIASALPTSTTAITSSAGADTSTTLVGETALAIINEALGLAPRAALRRTVSRFNHRRDEETAQQIIALASSV